MSTCLGSRECLKSVAAMGVQPGRCTSSFLASSTCIADIPPALAVSHNYLAKVLPDGVVGRYSAKNPMDRTINFCLPHQLSELPDKYFDLCINLSSFDEMPPEISTGYLKEFDRLCSGHVFLNGHARTSQRGNRLGLDELPYSSAWQLVFSNPHAVVDSFVEKLFVVPSGSRSRPGEQIQ